MRICSLKNTGRTLPGAVRVSTLFLTRKQRGQFGRGWVLVHQILYTGGITGVMTNRSLLLLLLFLFLLLEISFSFGKVIPYASHIILERRHPYTGILKIPSWGYSLPSCLTGNFKRHALACSHRNHFNNINTDWGVPIAVVVFEPWFKNIWHTHTNITQQTRSKTPGHVPKIASWRKHSRRDRGWVRKND